jgi:hypothetical protein
MVTAMTEYEPTPDDIGWAKRTISQAGEGEVIPSYFLLYRVSHTNKTLVLEGESLEWLADPSGQELHLRTKAVFSKIGWTVTEKLN